LKIRDRRSTALPISELRSAGNLKKRHESIRLRRSTITPPEPRDFTAIFSSLALEINYWGLSLTACFRRALKHLRFWLFGAAADEVRAAAVAASAVRVRRAWSGAAAASAGLAHSCCRWLRQFREVAFQCKVRRQIGADGAGCNLRGLIRWRRGICRACHCDKHRDEQYSLQQL